MIQRVRRPLLDVLGVLLEAYGQDVELHGWDIIKKTQLRGPTVYRIFDRLEDDGLVTGRWEEDQGRPRRRYYKLTKAGVAEAGRILGESRG